MTFRVVVFGLLPYFLLDFLLEKHYNIRYNINPKDDKMSLYCIHSETQNKSKCIVSGDNLLDALNNNPNVIRYYIGIGKRAKNICISVGEPLDKNFSEYTITVKYTHYKPSGKKEGIMG